MSSAAPMTVHESPASRAAATAERSSASAFSTALRASTMRRKGAASCRSSGSMASMNASMSLRCSVIVGCLIAVGVVPRQPVEQVSVFLHDLLDLRMSLVALIQDLVENVVRDLNGVLSGKVGSQF